MKRIIFSFIFLVGILLLAGCGNEVEQAPPEVVEFAKCVKESGVVMYGSITCHVCDKQKDLFMSAFEELGEVECHPNGRNPQPQLCLEKDIEATPTWLKEDAEGNEIDRKVGFQDFNGLAEFSGCEAP